MNTTKHILVLAILILSCKSESKQIDQFTVQYKGALKNMMHKGDISAKVDLKEFENTEHFFALGAIENLKGEIQIFDSKSFNTTAIDNTLNFDNSFDKKATLLVYAQVEKWNSIAIPDNISTYQELEKHIAQVAKENHINIEEPFPFLLEGLFKSFDWHVINWKDGDTIHSHQKHINSGLNGTINNKQVDMLGFYSDSHHAIFTHHTTNMHIHVKSTDNTLAGHVDGLILGKGMTLKLPIIK